MLAGVDLMNRAGSASWWGRVGAALHQQAASLQKCLRRQRPARRLRLAETLSLGEKRFLAVVQFQQQEFLVGATGQSIVLLAKLGAGGGAENGTDRIQEDVL